MPRVSRCSLWAPLPPYHLPAVPSQDWRSLWLLQHPLRLPLPHHACWQGVSRLTEQQLGEGTPPWGFRGPDPGLHLEGEQDWATETRGFWAEGRRHSGVRGFLLMRDSARRWGRGGQWQGQGPACFFCEGPGDKYFRCQGPDGPCHCYSTATNQTPRVWTRLAVCPKKTLLSKAEGESMWPTSHSLPTCLV